MTALSVLGPQDVGQKNCCGRQALVTKAPVKDTTLHRAFVPLFDKQVLGREERAHARGKMMDALYHGMPNPVNLKATIRVILLSIECRANKRQLPALRCRHRVGA